MARAEERILPVIRAAQGLGTEAHHQLEAYLLSGTVPTDPLALALLPLAPPRGPDLIVEGSTTPLLTVAGIRFIGRIDWAHGRIPTRPIVADWKTRSDLDKYAKTTEELRKDIQMVSYAKWATLAWPAAQTVDVQHLYVETKHHKEAGKLVPRPFPPRVFPLSVEFTLDVIDRGWSTIEQLTERMKAVARHKSAAECGKPSDLKAPDSPCKAFGGCGYKWTCPHWVGVSSGGSVFSRLGKRDTMEDPGTNGKQMTLSELLAKSATPPAPSAPADGILPPDAAPNINPPSPVATPAPAPVSAPVTASPAAPHEHAFSLLGVCSSCGKRRPGRPPKAKIAPIEAGSLTERLPGSRSDSEQATSQANSPGAPGSEGSERQESTSPAPVQGQLAAGAREDVQDGAAAPAPSSSGGSNQDRATATAVTTANVQPGPAPETAPAAPAHIGLYGTRTLAVNAAVAADFVTDLGGYVASVASELARAGNVPDVRCVTDKSHPYAYGGWRGVLAARVRELPPAGRGVYSIWTRGDELAEVVAATLAPTFDVVIRGA